MDDPPEVPNFSPPEVMPRILPGAPGGVGGEGVVCILAYLNL